MDDKRKFAIDLKDPRTLVLLVLALPFALGLGWACAAFVIMPNLAAWLTALSLLGLCIVFRLHRYI